MGMYTELTKNGKVKTDLTDLICPAWRKYGKQPNPQQKDPNVASFFMNVTLIDGSLYISCNETGAKKKYISFYIPGDSITTFCQRLGSFIQELAKEGTASALFPYKNKEGVDVKLSLYAVVDKSMPDGGKASYLKTTIEQGSDKIEFTSALGRGRSNFNDKGKDFFASVKAMSDAFYTTLVSQSNGLYIDHITEVKKTKKSDWKEDGGSYSGDGASASESKTLDYLD